MKSKLPVLFIMDMDKTIIGESDMILGAHSLIDFVRNCCKTNKIQDLPCPKAVKYQDLTIKEFIRPDAKNFFHKIKENFPTAEFFIYSHGTKDYVDKMIPMLEKELDMQFARPIFTRNDCIQNERGKDMKTVMVHYDTMIKSLVNKYPALKDKKNQDLVIKERILFIDDNDMVWDIKTKWIKCPHYSYKPIIDIQSYIDSKTIQHELVQSYIKAELNYFVITNVESNTIDEQKMAYHVHMASLYQSVVEVNRDALKDKFFDILLNVLKPYKNHVHLFKDEYIEKINKTLENKLKKAYQNTCSF